MMPGSHKANVPITGKNLIKFVGDSGNLVPDLFAFPILNAGDLLIFNEALIHGTAPWQAADRKRQILCYRFAPAYMAWRNFDSVRHVQDKARNEYERRLFAGPYIGDYGPKQGASIPIVFRKETIPDPSDP